MVTTWLREGKVYDNLTDAISELAEEQIKKNSGDEGGAPIDVATLSRAAKEALPAETVQTNIEAVLDGSYDWLEGKTEKLEFKLQLGDAKAKFIEALGNESLARVSNLQPCPEGTITEEFDPLSASCIPTGTDVQALINQMKGELAASPEFLPNTEIKSDDIKLGSNQASVEETFKSAPLWYKLASLVPALFSGLGIIYIGLIFLLSRPRRQALKTLAWTMGVAGLLIVLTGFVGQLLAGRMAYSDASSIDGGRGIAEKLLLPVVELANDAFSRWSIIFGSGYLIVALVLVLIYVFTRQKSAAAPEQTSQPDSPTDDSKADQQPAMGKSSPKKDDNKK